jgi:mevalonate kinase
LLEQDKIIESIAEECVKYPGRFGIFLGAGASVSSGLPQWNKLKDLFLEELYPSESSPEKREEAFKMNFHKDYRKKIEKSGLVGIPPEAITLEYSRNFGRQNITFRLEEYLNRGKLPNKGYKALRKLAKTGTVNRIFSVNIDELVERSMDHSDKNWSKPNWQVLLTEYDFKFFQLTVPYIEKCIIAKLHGTYSEPNTLSIDLDSIGELSKWKRNVFIDFIRTHKIIFIGYKGADPDIKNILLDSTCVTKLNEKGIYFITHKDSKEPNDDQRQILTHFKSKSNFLPCDSDYFLIKLLSMVRKKLKKPTYTINIQPWRGETLRSRQSRIINDFFNESEVVVSSPGSCIITGDYSCYINGKMIQLSLPVRLYVGIKKLSKHAERDEFETIYYDPFIGDFVKDHKATINKSMRARLRATLEYLRGGQRIKVIDQPILEFMKKYPSIMKTRYKVIVVSEMFYNIGLGDNLIGTSIAAIVSYLDKSIKSTTQGISLVKQRFLVELIVNINCILDYHIAYQNTSYLRNLPIYSKFSPKKPVLQFNRKLVTDKILAISTQETFDYFDLSFERSNRKLKGYEILMTMKNYSFPFHNVGKNNFINVAIAEAPRTYIRAAKKADTGSIVSQTKNEKNRHIFSEMAEITNIIENLLQNNKLRLKHLKKYIFRYQECLNKLGRSNTRLNKMIVDLKKISGVVGAKLSGSGPGGAVLIFYGRRANFDYIMQAVQRAGYEILIFRIQIRKESFQSLWLHMKH